MEPISPRLAALSVGDLNTAVAVADLYDSAPFDDVIDLTVEEARRLLDLAIAERRAS